MNLNFNEAAVFLLIMMRMTGMLVTNPILGRRGIPSMANAGLAFMLAMLLLGHVPAPAALYETATIGLLLGWVAKELFIGILAGFVLNLFLSVLAVGGEIVDMQLGLSMAKAFDPGTNASLSLTSQYYNIMFVLVFFLSNGHLTFIQMTARSFSVLPLGSAVINPDAFYLIPQLFGNILLLGVNIGLPIVVVETVTTFAVGIIMRIIPQINVFVVNIQFKLLVGMLLLFLLTPTFTAFMENLFAICIDNIQTVWLGFVPPAA